jgi:hypothetical protein
VGGFGFTERKPMPYLFTTPTVEEGPAGGHRLFHFYTLDRGVTVVRTGTSYQMVRFPSQDLLEEVDEYWLGGSTTEVDDNTAAGLDAAGFGDYLTEIV